MSKQDDIKREIAECEKEIDVLEKKRARSQAALVEALIDQQKPDEEESSYFKKFSRLIEIERENIRTLTRELESLS